MPLNSLNISTASSPSWSSSLGGLYVTDHPDDPHESLQQLSLLYQAMRQFGFDSVRYDWRWLKIEPRPGEINQQQLTHYHQVKKIMDNVGLSAPTIVLSSPPLWASELYRHGDKASFFGAYRRYVEQVVASLGQSGCESIHTVQVFNELNNRLDNFVRPEDIQVVCTITREAFRKYAGKLHLSATLLALPRRPLVDSVLPFLREHRAILESNFDTIGVDYYPGTWHWPTLPDILASLRDTGVQADGGILHGMGRAVVGNMTLLEVLYSELSSWQIDYELAEVGWASYSLLGGELAQKACFAIFLDAYQTMLSRLELKEVSYLVGLASTKPETRGRPDYFALWQNTNAGAYMTIYSNRS